MNIIQEIISAEKPKPFATINGKGVYTFYDANLVNQQALAEQKLNGREFDMGGRDFRPNGMGIRRIRADVVAMNPNTWFSNRIHKVEVLDEEGKVKETMYEVVNDYRAIKEQNTGNVYCKHLTCWVIGKHTNGGATCKGSRTISDDEFVKDFTDELDLESAMKAALAIDRYQKKNGTNQIQLKF